MRDPGDQTVNVRGAANADASEGKFAYDRIRSGSLSWRNNKLILSGSQATKDDLNYAGIIKGLEIDGGEKPTFVINGLAENLFNMGEIRQLPAAAAAVLKRHIAMHPKDFVASRAR